MSRRLLNRPKLRLRGKKFNFTVPLGGAPAAPSEGSAEYDAVARPERTAATLYTGTGLIKLDVPILFDGWPDQGVGRDVEQIVQMSRGQGNHRPPDFTAEGPIPFSGGRFIMELPEWGASLRTKNGDLVRQELILKLVQFVDPSELEPRKVGGQRAAIHRPAVPLNVKLFERETLLHLANRVLGDASRAAEIGRLNGIQDVRRPLPAGRTITLPRG